MKNFTRALTAALAAGLAFGVATPQSFAKPGAHGLSATVHGQSATATTEHGKAATAEQHKSAHLAAKALREAARKDQALARVVRPSRLAHLTDEWAAALQSNVAEDQAGLDTYVATLSDQDVTAEAAAAAVAGIHAVRPEGYLVVENQLRHAARLLAEIGTAPTDPVTDPTAPVTDPTAPVTDPTAPVTDPTAPVTDPTAPVTDPTAPVTDPSALVASAVEKALAYRADHPKSELRAIQRDLAAAEAALDGTDDGTDSTDGTDDTTGTTTAG
jgi:hypothetical protein